MQNWSLSYFSDLSLERLYAILLLRTQIFVVEQHCAYQELDGLDHKAIHLYLDQDGTMIAYARILPPGLVHQAVTSIGRVVIHPDHRGQGLGQVLMQKAIDETKKIYPNIPVHISAQHQLQSFYERLGFIKTSEPYDDAGILHIDMLLPKQPSKIPL